MRLLRHREARRRFAGANSAAREEAAGRPRPDGTPRGTETHSGSAVATSQWNNDALDALGIARLAAQKRLTITQLPKPHCTNCASWRG